MRAVRDHPSLDLQLIVGASALLDRFGGDSLIASIEREFRIDERVYTVVEGDTPGCMALTEGLFTTQLVNAYARLCPDVVLCHGDRHEVLAAATAAAYGNITLAHTEGGEVTGSIDDKVRNAITALADIHFPVTWQSAMRVRAMRPEARVHVVGSTALDALASEDLNSLPDIRGVGAAIDIRQPYIVVLQHSNTQEYGSAASQVEATLEAVLALNIPTIWGWPNADPGSDDIAGVLRRFREQNTEAPICFVKQLPPVDYARLLKHTVCLIGNTSSGIKEGCFLGTPYVCVGTRQQGREHGDNVIFVPYDSRSIIQAVEGQMRHGRYEPDYRFGDGSAADHVVRVLAG